jgi:Protein of unknown function (DUF742)
MSAQDPDPTAEEERLSRLLRSADPTTADPVAAERRTRLFHAGRQRLHADPGEAARIDAIVDAVLPDDLATGISQAKAGDRQSAADLGRGWARGARSPVGDGRRHEAARPNPVALVDASLVRAYALTGGRTRTRYQMAIEALVSTTPQGRAAGLGLPSEYQRVCDLCVEVKALAEIAALMRMPLGVVRVMVGELAEAGLVTAAQTGAAESGLDLALLERVLLGLRNL